MSLFALKTALSLLTMSLSIVSCTLFLLFYSFFFWFTASLYFSKLELSKALWCFRLIAIILWIEKFRFDYFVNSLQRVKRLFTDLFFSIYSTSWAPETARWTNEFSDLSRLKASLRFLVLWALTKLIKAYSRRWELLVLWMIWVKACFLWLVYTLLKALNSILKLNYTYLFSLAHSWILRIANSLSVFILVSIS